MTTETQAPDPAQADRARFETYFAESRRSRGPSKRPTFEQFEDGTYKDDHTQRHWWTWQQARAIPAPEGAQLPPLPKVGPIGFASVVDVEAYASWLQIGPHLPGVRDVALWTTDQMRAYARAALAREHMASIMASTGKKT